MTNNPSRIATEIQKRNFRFVQIDAVGVSMANVAAPFLSVFLIRLGASNSQVGLLSSLPGFTGLILAILVGRFLQTRSSIVPWYSLSRLAAISCYTLTGLLAFFIPDRYMIIATLLIWAIATLPQITLNVAFSVLMNAVAGPEGRYDLLSRRWTIMGFTGVIITFIVTRLINVIDFPANYGYLFLVLSIGGLISFIFSNRITVPRQQLPPLSISHSFKETLKNYRTLLRTNPSFVSFATRRFVYLSALALSVPIMPIFFVRQVGATDSQIGSITMIYTLVMLMGYFLWPRVSRKRGGRFVLLATTLGMATYPALTASFPHIGWIMFFAGVAGLFQAGLDLVFFDELMKTVPPEYSPTFVSLAQSMQYLSIIIAPILGTYLVDFLGLAGTLWLSTGLRLLGFLLFFIRRPKIQPNAISPG